MSRSTQIMSVESKSKLKLMQWVQSQDFKVEIKGNPVKDGSRWVLFFILPDGVKLNKEVLEIKLD